MSEDNQTIINSKSCDTKYPLRALYFIAGGPTEAFFSIKALSGKCGPAATYSRLLPSSLTNLPIIGYLFYFKQFDPNESLQFSSWLSFGFGSNIARPIWWIYVLGVPVLLPFTFLALLKIAGVDDLAPYLPKFLQKLPTPNLKKKFRKLKNNLKKKIKRIF